LCLLEEEPKVDTNSRPVMRRSLTKQEIVKKQPEIDRIFKTGQENSCRGLRLIVSKNQFQYNRIIVIPVRHYGTAVQRNRIRRQIKEIWRNEKPKMVPGYDFAFVVYPGKALDHEKQAKQIVSLCKRAGVYGPDEG
jgi:ribonuclease P protein component